MMHFYSIDSEERKRVPLYLAVLAILSALAFDRIIVALGLRVPWWFDAPAVMGFYKFWYDRFDRSFWNSPFVRKLGLAKAPNFSGQWQGEDHVVF